MTDRLCFGGSFNPPHLAHTACAAAAAQAAGLAGVTLIPNGSPALKSTADIAPAADRLAMTRLAAAGADAAVPFDVDDLETRRTGTTYTIDTVLALRNSRPGPVHWLIGADQLLNLHRWHRFDELLTLARFWVMARPGYAIDWSAVDARVRPLGDCVVRVPQLDISATEIRRRLRESRSIDGLVAPAVADYLHTHRLYLDS